MAAKFYKYICNYFVNPPFMITLFIRLEAIFKITNRHAGLKAHNAPLCYVSFKRLYWKLLRALLVRELVFDFVTSFCNSGHGREIENLNARTNPICSYVIVWWQKSSVQDWYNAPFGPQQKEPDDELMGSCYEVRKVTAGNKARPLSVW